VVVIDARLFGAGIYERFGFETAMSSEEKFLVFSLTNRANSLINPGSKERCIKRCIIELIINDRLIYILGTTFLPSSLLPGTLKQRCLTESPRLALVQLCFPRKSWPLQRLWRPTLSELIRTFREP
jgi:hypothetical protein